MQTVFVSPISFLGDFRNRPLLTSLGTQCYSLGTQCYSLGTQCCPDNEKLLLPFTRTWTILLGKYVFDIKVDLFNLETQNQSKNIPMTFPSSPIKIWGKSVQGFQSYDLTDKLYRSPFLCGGYKVLARSDIARLNYTIGRKFQEFLYFHILLSLNC